MYMSLDYDLGCEPCCPGCVSSSIVHHRERNGSELLVWMFRNRNWPLFRPLVHSLSPNKKSMEMYIDEHGPYGAQK